MREKILNLLAASDDGLTSRDLAIALRCPRASIRRLLGALKLEGMIYGTGEYRAGAAVVTAVPQMSLWSADSAGQTARSAA